MSQESRKRDIEQAFGTHDVLPKTDKKRKRRRRIANHEDNNDNVAHQTSTTDVRDNELNNSVVGPPLLADAPLKNKSTSSKRRRRTGGPDYPKEAKAVEPLQDYQKDTALEKSSDDEFHTPTDEVFGRKVETEFADDSQESPTKHKKSRKRKRRSSKALEDVSEDKKPKNSSQELSDRSSFFCPIESCSRHEKPFSRRKKFNRHLQEEHTNADFGGAKALEAALVHKHKHEKRKVVSSYNNELVEGKAFNAKEWSLSPPSGGRFINQDPILTNDGKNLILPTKKSVQIYSTKTSLLLRNLVPNKISNITCCCLDATNSTHVIVGFDDGFIQSWDWTTGQELSEIIHKPGLIALSSDTESNSTKNLLALCGRDAKTDLTLLKLGTKGKVSKAKMLEREALLPPILTSIADGIIAICSMYTIIIGLKRNNADETRNSDSHYWREVNVDKRIISYDATIRSSARQSGTQVPVVDIALGLENGEIQVYQNVLAKAIAAEKGRKADLKPRKLHWHRTAVNTVKWSRDGNYLISGGNETVLVMWQLDTNNKQFLPHLSSPILNLTISKAGDAYGIRLADNSVMVISTADLKPFANVSGLALGNAHHKAAIHPVNHNQMLIAVPSDALSAGHIHHPAATLLQTYDVQSNLQLNRQALTRNLTTTVRVRPDGKPIREPDVVQLGLSHDGKWLVTVDEWTPEYKEVKIGHGANEESEKETFLRFWTVNETDSSWELNTRIDEPVSQKLGTVLGLSINPSKIQAVTVGSNGHIKFWSPKARIRNGIAVKNNSGQPLFTWTCDREMEIASASSPANSAAVAFSEDGSVLAVSWSSLKQEKRVVHIIDPKAGSLCQSVPGIVSQGKSSLTFSGRYLVLLSSIFCIFDTVALESTYILDIDPAYSQTESILAANASAGTVAVAANSRHADRSSKVLVFDPLSPEKGPIHEASVDGQIRALLASKRHGGYIVLDGDARIKQLAPPGTAATSSITEPHPEELKQSLDNIFGPIPAARDNMVEDNYDEEKMIEEGKQQTLEEVLNIQSTASAPSLTELFNSVAKAVSSVFT